MKPVKTIGTLVALSMLSLTLMGCSGEGSGLYAVSGEITFQDKPLDNGSIQFHPDDPAKCNGGGAVIANGKYAVPKLRGLKPGTYKVIISAGDAKFPEPTGIPANQGRRRKNGFPPIGTRNRPKKLK